MSDDYSDRLVTNTVSGNIHTSLYIYQTLPHTHARTHRPRMAAAESNAVSSQAKKVYATHDDWWAGLFVHAWSRIVLITF